jgi:hypothetical protein
MFFRFIFVFFVTLDVWGDGSSGSATDSLQPNIPPQPLACSVKDHNCNQPQSSNPVLPKTPSTTPPSN